MKKIISRVIRNRRSPDYGKVELKTVEAIPPKLGITHLISDNRCIHPVFIEGVSGVCGNPTGGDYGESGVANGWLCPTHYLRSLGGEFSSRIQALEALDRDNIKFIIGQDRQWIDDHEDGGSVYWCGRPAYNECSWEEAAGVRLAPFRGWSPYVPKASAGVHDHSGEFEEGLE